MGMQIVGYDEDENPQYGWVDDESDQVYTGNYDFTPSDLATTGQGAGDIYSGSSSNIYPDGYGGYVNGNGEPVTIVKDADGTLKTSTG